MAHRMGARLAGRQARPGRWAAAIAAALLIGQGCGSPSQEPQRSGPTPETPEQTFRNLELRETRDGKLDWTLRARRAVRASASAPTRLESLRVEFYEGGPKVRSVLVADSGRVDLERGTLLATGDVVVTTPEGNRLETEELFWDRKNARVSSDRFVRLTRGEDVLTGIGFQSDPNLESYEIKREVRASLREKDDLRDEILGPDSTADAR